ncbi:S-adenosyl-L-methionine-dependent methyltransferase [Trametes versicolor FP-101664 SS1]|uniref:S-adenosyl-L-methionine-dependent methyltransferase n=1 Tax=Trametes versicolor (strain FP-101664) TaxID=717944 RepID=UPI0004621D94|nr:S-adenosyl-L-methionine-dependent methyltransferase [Trametes versicolor FP-101664 SS1]EIW60962.1 S-adenosyl-L-methionine-dependent methyltransferase [Trametes versicolor FP-101664 SS1]
MAAPTPTHEHHSHDFAEANKAFFDQHAHEPHRPDALKLRHKTVAAMQRAHPALFDEDRTEVLDYACGVGLLSQALCPHVKSIVGVDISQASVDAYNAQASNQGLEPTEMRAVCAELTGAPGELDDAKFDVVVCSAAYHHFPSIADTTRVLAHFLKPGGSLLVADIKAAPDGHALFKETHHHIVPHKHGLTEEAVRGAFEGAGLVEFELADAFRATMSATGEETQWFVARGVKPA